MSLLPEQDFHEVFGVFCWGCFSVIHASSTRRLRDYLVESGEILWREHISGVSVVYRPYSFTGT